MKKITAFFLALGILLALCVSASAENVHFDKLTLAFAPSLDANILMERTKELPDLVKAEMSRHGYDVDEVAILVGESYEDTAKMLSTGTADLAWLPGAVYASCSDSAEVLLTATRGALSNDSEDPADWNGEENSTFAINSPVSYYRALICAGPSEYGQMLAKKVNAGEPLSWDELNGARWAVQMASSSAGYIYPTMWLMDNYGGKKISDLENVKVIDSGYDKAFSLAADETADIIVIYADARLDYEECWMLPGDRQDENGNPGLGRNESIWDEVSVIGVTERIYNDTVSVSKESPFYTNRLKATFQDSFINIIGSEEGKAIFNVYSHNGYVLAVDSDYDGARIASLLVA